MTTPHCDPDGFTAYQERTTGFHTHTVVDAEVVCRREPNMPTHTPEYVAVYDAAGGRATEYPCGCIAQDTAPCIEIAYCPLHAAAGEDAGIAGNLDPIRRREWWR